MIIFDICGTLYSCNTTFDFCKAIESRAFYRLILKASKSILGKIINRILEKTFGFELIRMLHINVLRGMSQDDVEEKARDYVRSVLVEKKIQAVHELLARKKTENTILVSATIEPIAKAIAIELDIPRYLATTLKTKNGIFTGKIERDLLGNKHKLLSNDNIELVVTDNKSDYKLCQFSNQVVIVSKQSDLKFWNDKKLPNFSIIKV